MQITLNTLCQAVSEYFKLLPETIFKKSRKREIVDVRSIFFYLARVYTSSSFQEIADFPRLYGRARNHSTVIHSVNKITDLVQHDRELRTQVNDIIALLTSEILNKTGIEEIKNNVLIILVNSKDVKQLKTDLIEYISAQ